MVLEPVAIPTRRLPMIFRPKTSLPSSNHLTALSLQPDTDCRPYIDLNLFIPRYRFLRTGDNELDWRRLWRLTQPTILTAKTYPPAFIELTVRSINLYLYLDRYLPNLLIYNIYLTRPDLVSILANFRQWTQHSLLAGQWCLLGKSNWAN